MPRRPSSELRKDWKVCLPATLAGAVELQLLDRLTGKPTYAARSKLITQLLQKWLEENHHITIEVPAEFV